ncbi:MAG: hypothetical protein A2951_02605 [Candidatus Buchananbacteria bacterium RIFCSPLOWO2_01_FULL_56_15]|uniref:SH3b domain-containing protein n=1 Tax=Candidatus Buchananbacteria bacterium RIFCSPLOWO2_01_FULL_56_15 TaxID=1797547 RepID=A0A1G1YUA6_9BACT|nr:MAG: hypothetical protein A2951_02605 [Candidatus Buchananbacteria bacterium RIFCSPLOWO2_01_FULL_56_15]
MAKRKIFGLDISDHSIEAVLLKRSRRQVRVSAYARTVLRTSAVVNGTIKQPDKLAEALKALLASAKPRPITTPYCILSIPDAQVFTAVFKFPAGLRRGEIMKTIPFKAEEIIPFKPSEIYFDFKTITLHEGTQEVFYVAVPQKVADGYVAVLQQAGLVPVALDVESVSLARALIDPATRSAEPSARLLMDIGSRTTNLNIFDRGGIRQSLTVAVAGNRFTRALMAGLSLKEKDAQALKVKVGVSQNSERPDVSTILQKELSRLAAEAQKLINFFQTENQHPVGSILLAGGSSLMPGIGDFLHQKLGLPVTVGNPLERLADPVKLPAVKKNAVLFANVIGLGLRGAEAKESGVDINLLLVAPSVVSLLPPRADKTAWRRVYRSLAAFGVLSLVLVGLILARQQGFDPYGALFSAKPPPATFVPAVNLDVLEELRAELLLPKEIETPPPAEPQPTSTPTLLKKVLISQTTTGRLNVRTEPNATSAKIGEAAAGQQYPLFDEADGWYRIQLSELLAGWVSATYASVVEVPVTPDGSLAATSTPTSTVEVVKPQPIGRIRVRSTDLGYLNVRSGPGTGNAKVGEAKVGAEYDILASQSGWYQIQFTKEKTGWVSSVYVDKL